MAGGENICFRARKRNFSETGRFEDDPASKRRGGRSGGASMAKPLDQITFLDIYRAVDCVEEGALFHFHENPNPNCPVGRNVHRVLDGRLKQIQDAMEREMAGITLESVMKDTENCIKEESRG